jgi:hypothetical protein
MYGVLPTAPSLVVLGPELARGYHYTLITLLLAAPWLDFAGTWLTKYAARQLAVLTVIGGFTMGIAYVIVAAIAAWQMWRPQSTHASSAAGQRPGRVLVPLP